MIGGCGLPALLVFTPRTRDTGTELRSMELADGLTMHGPMSSINQVFTLLEGFIGGGWQSWLEMRNLLLDRGWGAGFAMLCY